MSSFLDSEVPRTLKMTISRRSFLAAAAGASMAAAWWPHRLGLILLAIYGIPFLLLGVGAIASLFHRRYPPPPG